MRKALMTMVALAGLGAASVSWAQGAPAAPAPAPVTPKGFHTHDGFFLQMDLGLGAMSSKADNTFLGDIEYSGTAGQFSIALGYAVIPNLVLAGQFWGVSVTDPDVKVNGSSLGSVSDATLGLSGFGLNVTYYFMPINIYVSATPSVGVLSAEQGGTTEETKSGFALRLAVGKEWWVSTNWGIGLNLQYAYGSNEADVTDPPTWKTNWFGVAFSATYN